MRGIVIKTKKTKLAKKRAKLKLKRDKLSKARAQIKEGLDMFFSRDDNYASDEDTAQDGAFPTAARDTSFYQNNEKKKAITHVSQV